MFQYFISYIDQFHDLEYGLLLNVSCAFERNVCGVTNSVVVYKYQQGSCLIVFYLFKTSYWESRSSLVAQMVKNWPAMQETRVWSRVGKIPWRSKWQLTPVFLPGEVHRLRSLVSYSSWGRKELDITERLTHTLREQCWDLQQRLSSHSTLT